MNKEALSEQRLQEIRERAAKATPAPWAGASFAAGIDFFSGPDGAYLLDSDEFEEQDMEFIVNAREDIPDLLAELTRSRAALLEKRNYDAPLHSAERTARVEALLKQFPDSRDLAFWALGESELRDRAEQTADQRVLEVERQRALAQRGEDLAFEKWQAAEQKLAEQRWIPVSEKLPPDSTSVLTFVDKHRGIVCVNQRRLDYWDSFNASVTHWRELPAAPSVEREG